MRWTVPGPLRLVRRPPRARTWEASGATVIDCGAIGFRDAPEADRQRWFQGFRRLLDGLDGPLQVVLESRPGGQAEPDLVQAGEFPTTRADMRAADLAFAAAVGASASSHRRHVQIVAGQGSAAKLESGLRELGIPLGAGPGADSLPSLYGQEHADHYQTAEGWTRSWYLARFPGVQLEAGWLWRLIPAGAWVRLAWHASPLPTSWAIHYLQRQLTHMRAAHLQSGAAQSDPRMAGALPAAEDLQRRLTASQDRAFQVSLYITLSAPNQRALEEGSQRLEAAARSSLCGLQRCRFRMLDAYVSTLPLGRDLLTRCHFLDSSSLATCLPWADAELNQSGGLYLGRHLAGGAPVLVDPFDQATYANANIGVFGHSGAGKTYLLSTLLLSSLGTGAQVYVIDPEHEYAGLASRLGGVNVSLALGSRHSLNVLELRPDGVRDEGWLGPAAADATDLCSIICGGLDEADRALVEQAVRRVLLDLEVPLLRDVAERLPESSRVARVLHRWVAGSLGQIFSRPTNVDLEAPLVVFGMRELREEMVAPVHFLLAEALWSRIKTRSRRRLLVIDELGLLFEDATIRRFVVALARRIRKYDSALIFATQNPGDLLSSEAGSVVATNPALLFFGSLRPGEAAKVQRTFQLSDAQRVRLEAAQRGEFMLAAGPHRLPLRVGAPPWQEAVMRAARSPPGRSV